jgi:hypothetical protein
MTNGTTTKRPAIYQLEMLAEQKYPGHSHAWYLRYAKMASRIIGWEQKYADLDRLTGCEVVLLLVEEEDYTTRSPAKKQAIADWRIEREGT